MKILLVGNGTLSVAHQEISIAAALKEVGHEVRLTHDLEWGFFNKRIVPPLEPGDIIKLRHGEYKPINCDFGTPDIIFGLDQSTTPFVGMLGKHLGARTGVMFLDFPKHVVDEGSAADYNPEYSHRYYNWLSEAAGFQYFVFNNKVAANHAAGVLNRKITLIWYPLCNLDIIKQIKPTAKNPYVVSCHRFVNYKGTDYLIKALYGIPIPYRAISVSGNIELQIRGYAEDMLGAYFDYIPKATEEEKLQIISEAAVLVYPQVTNWVGGLSPLEAMALRVPVVCFDYPVLRELYGDCAIYAEQRDVDSLQDRILKVLNGEFDTSIIDKAEKRIWSAFTPKQMAIHLTRMFDET